MIYLCKSGRSYDIPQEVFDELTELKAAVARPAPAVEASSAAVDKTTKGGK